MNKAYVNDLTAYTNWADTMAIQWLDQITDEQWNQSLTSSFTSVRQTALHIVSAKKVWIDYWKNVPAPTFLSATFDGTKQELMTLWENTSTNLRELIEQYPEECYHQTITLKWPRGGEGHMEFWQTFTHMINHTTYHRGQLVTLLRQVGFTTLASTDLATWYVTRNKIIF